MHKIPISSFSRQLGNHNGRLKNRDQLQTNEYTKTIGKGRYACTLHDHFKTRVFNIYKSCENHEKRKLDEEIQVFYLSEATG